MNIKSIASKYWLPLGIAAFGLVSAIPALIPDKSPTQDIEEELTYLKEGVESIYQRLDSVDTVSGQSGTVALTQQVSLDYLAAHQSFLSTLQDAEAQHLAAIVQLEYQSAYDNAIAQQTTIEWQLAARQKAITEQIEYLAHEQHGLISPTDGSARDQMSDAIANQKAIHMLIGLLAQGHTPQAVVFDASALTNGASAYTQGLYQLAQQKIQISQMKGHIEAQQQYETTIEPEGQNARAGE